MAKSRVSRRILKKSKSPFKSVLRTAKKSVGFVRSHIAVFRGKLIGYYAQRNDEASKLQKTEIEKLYKKIHGNVTDDYQEICKFIRARPGLLPSIQAIFDLEVERMGRDDKMSVEKITEEESDDFELSEPTAVVFVHNLLNDDIPDLTMTNYTEEEATNIVNNNTVEHAILPETKPYGLLGGKKTRKNRK
jgi:hypothetical protein